MAEAEILFEERGALGVITLNRPQALNALTLAMAKAMTAQLDRWAAAAAIQAVAIKGAAREDGKVPFCAGGDIRALYDARAEPGHRTGRAFYWHEYRLDARVFHFPKPYIALIDGVVMGGGVGVSIHGSHRVFTERALFAMPETGIGLFPDVGGTYFLPRLKEHKGLYLALTGARLKAADALALGLASHHVPSARMAALEAALAEAAAAPHPRIALRETLARFAADPGAAPLGAHDDAIERAFSAPTLDGIVAALEADPSPWAARERENLRAKSPTSLAITLRQMHEGVRLAFDDCMRLEYRIACRVLEGVDFYEGIRAVIIDKDNAPSWRPATLGGLEPAAIEAYFAPLGPEELDFASGAKGPDERDQG